MYELIASADNMKIIAHLIEATSYSDTMALPAIDNEYEKEDYPEKFQLSGIADSKYMQHRYMAIQRWLSQIPSLKKSGVSPWLRTKKATLPTGSR